MRWLAIANPAAGRAREAEGLLRRLAGSDGVRHDAVRTQAPGHATQLAQQARDYDGLIAVGGDGTIAEVLRGMDLQRQTLAVLPAGHGNCLARDLGVGRGTLALTALRQVATRVIDLAELRVGFAAGCEQRRLFASTLAVGYVADVVHFGRHRLSGLGRGAYAAAAMWIRPAWFEARFDGPGAAGTWRRYTGIVVNNTAHLANFRGLPDASLHDGQLDVMEQGFGWPRQSLHNAAVLLGSRRFGPLLLRQAGAGRLDLARPALAMVDGELLQGVTQLEFACSPAALRCVAAAR